MLVGVCPVLDPITPRRLIHMYSLGVPSDHQIVRSGSSEDDIANNGTGIYIVNNTIYINILEDTNGHTRQFRFAISNEKIHTRYRSNWVTWGSWSEV